MSISKKELGNLVKEARKIKANKNDSYYSQSSLSKDIGKSRGYIGDIENGRCYPSYATLCSIAEACGVTVDFFQSDVEKTIEYQLSDYPEDTVNEVKECLMNDDNSEMSFLSSNDEDSIKLLGYFTKADFENDDVAPDVPTHRRIKLLMAHKGIDLKKLSELSGTNHDELSYICGRYILDKTPTMKISDDIYGKLATALSTTSDFLLCRTNYKWNCNSKNAIDISVKSKEQLIDFFSNNDFIQAQIKCDLSKLTQKEKNEFIDEILKMVELVSYKYKK